MKKMNFKLAILASALVMMFVTSCKKEDSVDYTPVNGTSFAFTVTDNTVVFTTTLSGGVWFTGYGQDFTAVNKTVTATIPLAGTYKFVCSTSGSGATLVSDTFNVVITKTDSTYFKSNKNYIFLSGGNTKTKGWVLDVTGKAFPGPLSFLGTDWDFVKGANDATADDAWMWNAGTSFTFEAYPNTRMWLPGTTGYGTMYFSWNAGVVSFTADKKKEGYVYTAGSRPTFGAAVTEKGTVTVDNSTNVLTISAGATILHSYKPYANTRVGTDTTWIDGNKGISDWQNYKIYALNDTILQLAVLRDQDVQAEGKCYLIYNFISVDYDKTHTAAATKSRRISLK